MEQDRLNSSVKTIIEKQIDQRGVGEKLYNVFAWGVLPGIMAGGLMDAAYIIRNNQHIIDHGIPIFPKFPKTMRFAHVTSCGLCAGLLVGVAMDKIANHEKRLLQLRDVTDQADKVLWAKETKAAGEEQRSR